jgi:hypothetical protein
MIGGWDVNLFFEDPFFEESVIGQLSGVKVRLGCQPVEET